MVIYSTVMTFLGSLFRFLHTVYIYIYLIIYVFYVYYTLYLPILHVLFNPEVLFSGCGNLIA